MKLKKNLLKDFDFHLSLRSYGFFAKLLIIIIGISRRRHTSVSIIAPSINKGLEMLSIGQLRFVFLPHVSFPFRLSCVELGEISEVKVKMRVRTTILKKSHTLCSNLIVRNVDERCPLLQHLLKGHEFQHLD